MMTSFQVMTAPLVMRLQEIRYVAQQSLSFSFVAPDESPLPAATPGAHIGLHLPNGALRQYSLIHTAELMTRYDIAVKYEPKGRGGSRFMHESLRVGTLLSVDPPRNNFPLVPDASHSIFIAGGIGITPIIGMIEHLAALGRSLDLHYAARLREEIAFLPLLQRFCQPLLHIDAEQGGRVLDLAAIVDQAPLDAHLYCCGPRPMLKAFETATRSRAQTQVHLEYFTPREAASTEGAYTVVLARSGTELQVPAGKRLLQVLREAGVTVTSSCEEGVCSACETRVLEGVPDHRDSILSQQERESGRTMMVCVSGSKGPRLVLDL
jgi:tetrachlorobenzoquinone reductase